MRVEVYNSEDEFIETFNCEGADIVEPSRQPHIDSTGLCHGCDGEYNPEKRRCYKAGMRIWFKDPAMIGASMSLTHVFKKM